MMNRLPRMPKLVERSINETLARTVMTSLTALLALVALVVFGGPVIRIHHRDGLGVFVGSYSTIQVASPMILHFGLSREAVAQPAEAS
jgi:preprotein translocase subunit SecF